MGKILVIIGLLTVVIGLFLIFKVPIPLGRFPGDIVVKGEHFQFYFPIVTSIVLSFVLSLLFYFFLKR